VVGDVKFAVWLRCRRQELVPVLPAIAWLQWRADGADEDDLLILPRIAVFRPCEDLPNGVHMQCPADAARERYFSPVLLRFGSANWRKQSSISSLRVYFYSVVVGT
jgi:hypothetical protein